MLFPSDLLIVRRFVLALFGLSITFLFTFLYCHWAIDGHGKRRIYGFVLWGLGILCGFAGMGLWFVTGFNWSWGWWL
jgi:hypothetical protein